VIEAVLGSQDTRVHLVESVACDAFVGARPLRGCSPMALAEELSVRPVPARTALYARHRPKMARKAHTRRWALEPSDGWDARSISRVASR
jgi:hypothetical protein